MLNIPGYTMKYKTKPAPACLGSSAPKCFKEGFIFVRKEPNFEFFCLFLMQLILPIGAQGSLPAEDIPRFHE